MSNVTSGISILCKQKSHSDCYGFRCNCECHRICFGCMTVLVSNRCELEQWFRVLSRILNGDFRFAYAMNMMMSGILIDDVSDMCSKYKDKQGCFTGLSPLD